MKKSLCCAVFAFVIAVFPGSLRAASGGSHLMPMQGTPSGAFTGIARDEAGSIIPNAQVVAVNISTNAEYRATTDEQGIYFLRELPVGTYSVVVEAPGFKRSTFTDAVVRVNEEIRLDVSLSTGGVTEEVTVTADTTPVNTTNSTLKTVISERQIRDLPLNGRNPNDLILLVAGTQPDTRSNLTSGTTYPGVTPISSNGARGNSTNYILDGGSNNDHYNNAPNPTPNPDALQEFSVQTNNFSAEYGRSQGAVVTAVTKSGTNSINGSLFEYLRNNALNANNTFSGDDGLKRNQFGGTVGGPLVLPRFGVGGPGIYNGRDRSFFFFSYQGTIVRRLPRNSTAITPTAAQLNGDFSNLLRQSNPRQLVNPVINQPYVNNQIPVSQFDPVALRLARNFLLSPTDSTGLVRYAVPDNSNDNQFLLRLDHQFTEKNKLFGRFWDSKASQPAYLDSANYLASSFGRVWRNRIVSANDTHIFSPNIINVLVLTYNSFENDNFQSYPQSLQSLGANIYNDQTPQININVNGYFSINTGDTNSFPRTEYQIANTTRVIAGRHNLSFGGDFSFGKQDITNNFRANGEYVFNNNEFTGDPLANFLLGRYSTLTQGLGQYKGTRFKAPGVFVQDDFRVNQRLTLNLGLRYDPFLPYTDTQDRIAGFRPGQQSEVYPNAPLGLIYPDDPGLPEGGYSASLLNFAPRVGLAYDLTGDGKTSIRAGYGIFYDRINTIATNGLAGQAPFGTTLQIRGNANNSFSDPYRGFAGGNPFPQSPNPARDVRFASAQSLFSYDENFRSGYLQSWNLTVEREILPSYLLRIAYAGSKGTRLPNVRELNPALLPQGATAVIGNAVRPLAPQFANIFSVESTANSNYNALLTTLDKRFSRGFSVLASYTWSKTIDTTSNNKINEAVTQVNPFDRNYDRGVSNSDRTHRYTTALVYDTPGEIVGNRFVDGVLGDWRVTGIVIAQTGVPFTVTSGADTALIGSSGGQRPNLVGNPFDLTSAAPLTTSGVRYFNPNAFARPANNTYGNVGRNTLRGPSYKTVDFGLQRYIPITEGVRGQFRFEAFNVFNFTNLGVPNTNLSGGVDNFGVIRAAEDPRILQFALRLEF